MSKLKIKKFEEIRKYVDSKKFIQELKLLNFLNDYIDEFPQLSESVIESYYLYYHNLNSIPLCPICRNHLKFKKFNKGYYPTCNSKECKNKYTAQRIKESFLEKYGVDNPSKLKHVQAKRESTFLKKYGVKNPYQSEVIKDKIKKVFISKYGVDNPMKLKSIRDKAVTTLLSRYGVTNAYQKKEVLLKLKERYGDDFGFGSDFFKKRSKETCLQKYNREHFLADSEIHKKITKTMRKLYGGRGMGSEIIKDKIEKTNIKKYGNKIPSKSIQCKLKSIETSIERYGTEHPMQNLKIFEKVYKHSFKLKKIILPSGKIEKVQGYEPYAIDLLLEQGYIEDDLIISNKEIEKHIDIIKYKRNNKIHRYYPDIYIKSENKVIEVKSEYTYNKNKKVNILKKQACLDKGINFEFWIFNKNNSDLKII